MLARSAMFASLVLALASGGAPQPQPASPAAAQRQRAADRVRALQAEATALAGREKTLLGELRRLEIEREVQALEIQRLEPEIAALESEVASTSAQLRELDQKVRDQQPALAARLVGIYKLGRPGYVRLWFGVDDPRALGRAYRLIAALARMDQDRISDFRATVAKLSAARGDLDRRFGELTAMRDAAVQAQADADQAAAARVRLIAEIDSRRDLNAQLVSELRQAQAKLDGVLSSLHAPGEAPPPAASLALPLRPFKGELDWPVAGTVITPFGPRVNPRFGTTTVSTGIEIAAAASARVAAVHAGVVAYADAFTGFGLLVIVDHGQQSYTLYGNLATIDVERGAYVAMGQAIGTVGRGPGGTPSLFFGLRVDGQAVDPVQWLKPRAGA